MPSKTTFTLICLFFQFCFFGSAASQSPDWFWQNPLPLGNTADGGSTWRSQASGTTNHLRGVSFSNALTGTAVGVGGTILHTTDGGSTWTGQASGTSDDLFGVYFSDALTGTAVGRWGTILRTTDGGSTWTSQTSGTTAWLYGVSFKDALSQRGVAVGDGGMILYTDDRGNTWRRVSPFATGHALWGVSFANFARGVAVGNRGAIVRTINGGRSWTRQTSGTTDNLWAVSFGSATTATAVGVRGTILRTTDGGRTWTSQTSGTTLDLFGVSFTDAMTGTAVGGGFVGGVGFVGKILRTIDGGNTWTQTIETIPFLYGVSFTDAMTGTAVGGFGTILRTSPVVSAMLDIKPGGCPNPFSTRLFEFPAGSNPRKGGVLPVAVLGSQTFDVSQIDVSTLRLEGVQPLMLGGGPKLEDVAAVLADNSDCACMDDGPDGFIDLKMKFLGQEIAAAVPMRARGEERVLTLTGELLDGTWFEATDCVVFVGPRDDGRMPANENPTLNMAFPNPFNPVTRISYSIPKSQHVRLVVYDVAGRLVEELADEVKGPGEYVVEWDAGRFPSGIYFYSLRAGNTTLTKKMVFLK